MNRRTSYELRDNFLTLVQDTVHECSLMSLVEQYAEPECGNTDCLHCADYEGGIILFYSYTKLELKKIKLLV
jgi:hypothetical protein